MWKTQREKNHGAKREISLNQRDYKEFLTLYSQFPSLGFHLSLRRKRPTFIVES